MMKRMKTAIAVAVAVAAMSAQAETIRVAVEGVYPPFNYMDKGQLTGFDVDIAKALCSKMKADCKFVTQEWDGMIPGLMTGKYDAIISSLAITEERKKRVDFSQKYYAAPARFIAAKSDSFTDVSPAALKGKRIGVQGSTVEAAFLQDVYKGVEVATYKSVDEANLDLAAGRVDLVLSDAVMLNEFLTKQKDGACCKFVGADIRADKYFGGGKGVAVRKGETQLVSRFDAAIKEILADGTYKSINAKYFPFPVY